MRSGVHAPAAFLKVFYLGRCDLSKNKLNFFGGQSRHTQKVVACKELNIEDFFLRVPVYIRYIF